MSINESNVRSLSLAEVKKLAARKKQLSQQRETAAVAEKILEAHPYPVTRAQQSFWLMSQTLAGAKNCNNPYAVTCHLQQALDDSLLRKSLELLSDQHSVLRTLFSEKEGKIYQTIQPDMPLAVENRDVQSLDRSAQQTLIEQYAIKASAMPFDLARGPLWRLTVFRRGPLEYVMVATFHHIISDGWTINVFFRSFMENYFRLLHGQSEFPPTTAHFIEYANAEAAREQTDNYQQSLEYWKTHLADAEGVLNLPLDFPRTFPVENQGGMVTVVLPADLHHAVDNLCRQENITVFHALLATWQWLLSSYSGQQDLIIGAPFANRSQPTTLETLGLLMNPLPLRGSVRPDKTLRELLQATKQVCEAALQHQQVSFQHILENIAVTRDPLVTPLFQAMITYQLFPHFRKNPYLKYSPLKIDYGITRTDLNLWIEEDNGQLLLTLYYRKQLFSELTAQSLLNNYLLFIKRLVEAPGSLIGTIDFLTQNEQDRHWLPAPSPAPVTSVLAQYLSYSQQAPDQLAVCCEQQQLSYTELTAQAKSLAIYLCKLGVCRGEAVGIFQEKSVDYLVSILGIWMSGACYVPLDKKLPEAQLNFILRDAEIKKVITCAEEPTLPTDIKTIILPQLENIGTDFLLPECRLDQLAYIIYTSGTTGQPKGVMVNHRQLAHYCHNIREVLAQPPAARYAMISAFSTDLAHTMLFPALSHGGSLVLISERLQKQPEKLFSWMAMYPVDCLKITPSWLNVLLTTDRGSVLLPESVLVLGGENLPRSLTARVRKLAPHCRIVNHYGPTETTVGVACYEIPEQGTEQGYWPIGSPLSGMNIVAVDSALRVLPAGIPGELCIVGPQVSCGYCNTGSHASFVKHPLSPTQQFYRTGDRGLIRVDKQVQFLGRKDRQVKIRGFRVNLNDIEILLSQLNENYDVAVTVWSPLPEQLQIVAFIAGATADEQDAFQQKAAGILTQAMMPALWCWRDSLPRLASGKINYSRLTQGIIIDNDGESLALNPTEKRLQTLYSQTLGFQVNHPDQHFLTLGGNSLQALSLIMKVNQSFETALPLSLLLDKGSIRQLAKHLQWATPAAQRRSLVCFQSGHSPQLPTWVMVHPAGGNILCYQPMMEAFGPSVPFYGLQVADFSTKADYHEGIDTLASWYLKELGDLIYRPQLVLGGWSLGATIAAELGHQIHQLTGCYPTLVVLDQPAPQLVADIGQQLTNTGRVAYFAKKVGIFTGAKLDISAEKLSQLNDTEQTALFLRAFRNANLVPENLSQQDFSSFLKILQAHIFASDHYSLEEYGGKIYVAEAEELLEGRYKQTESGLGWCQLSPGMTQVITAPGNHLTMMENQRLIVLSRRLWQVIHG